MTDPEHPAVQAARILKSLHEDTLSHINCGYRHYKLDEFGVEQDVTEEVIAECRKQMEMADKVIEAGRLRKMGHSDEAEVILQDIKKITGERRLANAETGADHVFIPEVGNFDHGRPASEEAGEEPPAEKPKPN